ncbi:ABC transporter ATP-binding protein [Pseudoxanthobacter sp.]|uniref:ABC transporter ATP-binding protein n=1 Tax=Pseudoxanthobacter sp. TaxID=1925742 RepID=UPI002FDF7715
MAIEVQDVGRTVDGEMHLAGINLSLTPGHLHVLVGRTGAGKTSLLRVLAGLDRPSGGRVMVDGRDARSIALNRRRVAFVYQQFVNYPSFTVFDNIAAPLRRAGMAREAIERRVRETAALLHIDHLLDRLPAALSGGQQQRVAIARALVKDADLLLLDEPLVNLDYKLREELRSELRTIFRKSGRLVVYTTTEPVEAMQMGGTTILMDAGRIIQTGPAIDVYHRPASLKAAEIFSDPPMNLVPARLEGDRLTVAGVTVPRPAHMAGRMEGDAFVGLRPSQLAIGLEGAPAGIALAGRVQLAEVNGSETFIHIEAGGALWIAERHGVHPTAPETPVIAAIDPDRLYLFAPAGALIAVPPAATQRVH